MQSCGVNKMKNKKETESTEVYKTYGGVILVMIAFIGLILYLHPYSNDPEFKIIKDKCFMKVNQTVYDNCVAEYDDNWDIEGTSYTTQITPTLENGLILFEFSENSSMSSLNIGGKIIETKNCVNVTLLYEKCERVEVKVEEIEFLTQEKNRSICCDENDMCSYPYQEPFCEGREVVMPIILNITICLSDLTIEWLDENCKCLNTWWDKCLIEKEKCDSSKKYESHNCQNYKCGEYFVEVLK